MPQSPKPDATTFPLGAHVRLRRGQAEATGVVIGNSTDIDRIQVQWDDTGEVTLSPRPTWSSCSTREQVGISTGLVPSRLAAQSGGRASVVLFRASLSGLAIDRGEALWRLKA